MSIELHPCPRLHARISASQCAHNRANADVGPCRRCSDWQQWADAPAPEPQPKKRRFNPYPGSTKKTKESPMPTQPAAAAPPTQPAAAAPPTQTLVVPSPDAATYFDQQREAEHEYRYGSDASTYHRLFENAPALPELFEALEHARNEHPDFVPTPMAALAILLEEVGEVAKAVNEEDAAAQREELLQCGAVILRWLSDDMKVTQPSL